MDLYALINHYGDLLLLSEDPEDKIIIEATLRELRGKRDLLRVICDEMTGQNKDLGDLAWNEADE